MSDIFESMPKDEVMDYLKVISPYEPGGTEENTRMSVRIFGDPAQIRTAHLPNTRQNPKPIFSVIHS
jgi:hypothetical protein